MKNNEKEIETNEFLKFLKIACHVNDLIRDSKESNSLSIDFDELASNKIINDLYGFYNNENTENIEAAIVKMDASEKSSGEFHNRRRLSHSTSSKQKLLSRTPSSEHGRSGRIHPIFAEKLDYLIGEGVLDSVLPFVCPVASTTKFCHGLQKSSARHKARDTSPGPISHPKSLPIIQADCEETPNAEEQKSSVLITEENPSSAMNTRGSKSFRRKSTLTTRTSLNAENKKQDRQQCAIVKMDASEKSSGEFHNRRRLSHSTSSKQKLLSRTPSSEHGRSGRIHPIFAEKLDYLIGEGVLDSVLPFVCPVASATKFCHGLKKSSARHKARDTSPGPISHPKSLPIIQADCEETPIAEEQKSSVHITEENPSSAMNTRGSKPLRRKSTLTTRTSLNAENKKQETEVVIHVCDEIKNTSKDFTCPQKLLVSKMGYFADVTAGQKLEDMDISVHCDIQIFEWLMKWIKKNPYEQDSLPQLDATNVVPILVSASFLQMEPLLLDCLSFCHARLSDVVRSSTNLSCLNDSIITRLAAMFTNLELEVVKDKKDRVTPRLWTKLIQSLCEPEPQALRGHYFSLAGLFRCSKCCKCLTQTMSSYISCVPSNIRLNRWGQLVSQHTRDASWNLSNYISSLFKELKSWRRVYWKLWGHCHFLYCCICETHFPVYQMTWCRFHPDGAQYLGPVTEGRIAGPAGRYPCCGQQAFRYESLPGPNGCQFREHSVVIENERDRSILTLLQIAAEGGNLFENPPAKIREEVSNNTAETKWIGLSLMPTKCRPGLLPMLSPDETNFKMSQKMRLGASHFAESSSEAETSSTPEKSKKVSLRKFSTSSDGCESESSSTKKTRRRRNGRPADLTGRFWSGELSARSNQDHQRDFEEKVMKQVTSTVGKKTGCDIKTTQICIPTCGTYIRLEAEWKEQLKQKNALKQRFK